MRSRLRYIGIGIATLCSMILHAEDSIPSGFSMKPEWHIGAESSFSFVPGTCSFLQGKNLQNQTIENMLSGGIRADFSFHPASREGVLYPDLYQGIGLGTHTFFANSLLGTPVSAYIYQGAPITHLNSRLWLGYEWKFGAAFGWKHHENGSNDNNGVVGTAVTALMALSFKLHYRLSDHWQMSLGAEGIHFSNGNTEMPNAGVNAIGTTVGIAYTIHPQHRYPSHASIKPSDADSRGWLYDLTLFGAWRKRIVTVSGTPELCPGQFGVAGFQLSPMYRLNRYVAMGPALDCLWDESAGLPPYWVENSSGKNIKFNRPPFSKQIAAGMSAHAELTMPIFAINVGMGYNLLNPEGDQRFYQMLTLKAFVSRHAFLNVGYRLGNFKDPQHLMLGVGYRF